MSPAREPTPTRESRSKQATRPSSASNTSVDSTFRDGVLGGIGGFSGLFALDERYEEPVLVASADGVGTKLEVARLLGRYDTVGIDLVAMLVDDLVCVGAEPLFVLDYLAVGSLNPRLVEVLVAGIAEGCRQAHAALLGGETAEHGGVMKPDDLDVAGFALGVVERRDMMSPSGRALATCCWACTRRAFARTATRSRARSS